MCIPRFSTNTGLGMGASCPTSSGNLEHQILEPSLQPEALVSLGGQGRAIWLKIATDNCGKSSILRSIDLIALCQNSSTIANLKMF